MKNIRRGLLACTLAGLIAPAFAQSFPREYNLQIDALPLVTALQEFSRQTGLQVGYLPRDRDDEKTVTAPLRGKYTAESALRELLAPSGLSFERINERTVAVMSQGAVSLPGSAGGAAWTYESRGRVAPTFLRLVDRQTPGQNSVLGLLRTSAAEHAEMPVIHRAAETNRDVVDHDVNGVEEIVVTGTHIRGVAPVGSQLIVIGRKEIEASGHGRIQDLLEYLPQNFSGSTSEDYFGEFGARNYTRGQAVDLRGLGASSTLVLVNGRRQPAGGTEGSFVDISSLATSAIERVEVMADGASAIYGADAIGGVVNFITRKDYSGVETNLRFATPGEATQERQASVLGGHSWKGGNVLLGYQYSDRDALMAADTPYGRMNQDYRSLGGNDYRAPYGNPGTILDPTTRRPAYAIPRGQDGTDLAASALIPGQNYWDNVTGIASLPAQTQQSAFLSLSQHTSDVLEFFAEGRYSQRTMSFPTLDYPAQVSVPPTNPFYVNPFAGAGPVLVSYAFADDLGGPTTETGDTQTYAFTTGAVGRLTPEWSLNIAATYGREKNTYKMRNAVNSSAVAAALADPNPETALNVFGDGANTNPATIERIRNSLNARGAASIVSFTATADGPVFALPAGLVTVAVGADYRSEKLETSNSFLPAPGNLTRRVAAAFGEAIVPIIGKATGPSGLPTLNLSLAARYENYSDFGSTLNPKVGLNFAPLSGVQLHASWGTSFRAPRFNEISLVSNPPSAFAYVSIPDPHSPSGFSDALVLTGNSPDLHEERADIWTTGLEVTPPRLPGLSIAATYFNLDYEGKIQLGGAGRNTLLGEREWAAIITRDPTQAQIDAVCGRADFVGICPSVPAAILDHRLRNLAVVRVRGIDFRSKYQRPLRHGNLELGLAGVYTLTYERAVTSNASATEILDTVGNPLSLRMRGTTAWDLGNWRLNAAVNYSGKYDDPVRGREVDSWVTIDASVLYEFKRDDWLGGTSIQLSAVNLLNKEPPFVNQSIGFDAANANQLGRWVGLSIRKRW